jgi:hypothetical protein
LGWWGRYTAGPTTCGKQRGWENARLGNERQDAFSSRAMTTRWIWFVPSKIWGTFASRM